MMKLVHITTVPISLAFFHGQVGFLKSRGFDVSVVSSPGEAGEEFSRQESVPFHPLPMSRKVSLLSDAISLYRLTRLINALKPDVVHSHTPKAGLLGTIAGRVNRVPVVFLSVFGLPQMTRTGLSKLILNAVTWLACRLAHRVWCDSNSMREYLSRVRLCPAAKITVLGEGSVNGVDAVHTFSRDRLGPVAAQTARGKAGIPPDALVLGYVGRIVRDKGMHELIRAWQSLRQEYPELHLLMVGSFELGDPLDDEDNRLLREDTRVHLTGETREVPLYLAGMDIFVMPSYREGFGLTNIEAAAMELPVVSTSIPGCIDSVDDGVTGTLVPPRDTEALKRAIQTYIHDPSLRKRHGAAGRRRALLHFPQERIWEALHAEYMQLLSQHEHMSPSPQESIQTP